MNFDHAFQVSDEAVKGNNFSLTKSESNHAVRVLRLRKHDELYLLDGIGNGYRASIESSDPTCVSGKILEIIPEYGENTFFIHLGIALIKRDRFEFILEKSTEMGVREITPLNLDRCVKKTINFQRCEKIVITAAKQCHRSRFPIIHPSVRLHDFFGYPKEQVIVGKMNAGLTLKVLELNASFPIHVIIGPEGDFSEQETKLMDDNDVAYFNLGNRRLRSETAALNSIAILNELLG